MARPSTAIDYESPVLLLKIDYVSPVLLFKGLQQKPELGQKIGSTWSSPEQPKDYPLSCGLYLHAVSVLDLDGTRFTDQTRAV